MNHPSRLKACPFCRSYALYEEYITEAVVRCSLCSANMTVHIDFSPNLVKEWNRRPKPKKLRGMK